MKTKFVVIASLLLAWVHWCTAATLVSVININRNGGTATHGDQARESKELR